MSDAYDQATLQEPSGGSEGERYQSFAALRQAHVKLREECSQGRGTAADIRRFIAQARNTGLALKEDGDRRGAQGILDYWSAELVTAPAGQLTPEDFIPAVLERFNLKQSASQPAGSGASDDTAEATKRSRDVIGFVAAARQWQEHGRKPEYLLSGDAIIQAGKYRHLDADIDELVAASVARRNNKRAMAVSIVAAVVLAIVGMLAFETWGSDEIRKPLVKWVRHSDTDGSTKVTYLRILGWLQRWQRPYDFSGWETELANVSAPKLRLHSPNFSVARLSKVDFQQAHFLNASFSDSKIVGTNFRKADLSLAQFRAAQIESTSFVEATLYRALFDKACLRDVDFSGADLRSTSFWGATFDKDRRIFKNTAWWLAEGWNADDLRALVLQDQSNLSKSEVFKDELREYVNPLSMARAGTGQRSRDLNSMAWIIAKWGLVNNTIVEPIDTTKRACMNATGVPGTALEAAEQAVCIATSHLNTDLAADHNDTRAYILMQMPGRIADALEVYRTIPLSGDDGGARMFRAAVAYFATGDNERAMAELKRSMAAHYVPSHELHTLKAHIKGDFQSALYRYLDAISPKPTGGRPCEFTSDAVNP
jgi:hypothetical protein